MRDAQSSVNLLSQVHRSELQIRSCPEPSEAFSSTRFWPRRSVVYIWGMIRGRCWSPGESSHCVALCKVDSWKHSNDAWRKKSQRLCSQRRAYRLLKPDPLLYHRTWSQRFRLLPYLWPCIDSRYSNCFSRSAHECQRSCCLGKSLNPLL